MRLKANKYKNIVPAVLGAFLITVSLYHFAFAKRVIPGVRVGQVNIGGLSFDEAVNKLAEKEKLNISEIKIKAEENEYTITPENLKLKYDWEKTVGRAFEIGRTGNIYTDTKDKIVGVVKPLRINAQYDYDETFMSSVIAEVKTDLTKTAEDAKIEIAQDKKSLVISPETQGKSVDEEDLYQAIKTQLNEAITANIEVPVETDNPKITATDIARVQDKLAGIVLRNFTLTSDKESYNLTSEEILKLIRLEKTNDGVIITINKETFNGYQEELEKKVNKLPLGRVEKTDGDRVLSFKILQDGKQLDDKTFSGKFKTALFEGQDTMEIPVVKVDKSDNGKEYGIYALLGRGESKFTGSASPRIHNLSLAAEKTNGVLIPPGEVYSFNNSVGDINGKEGFQTAYIISGGRTVLGEGGGVCQTSTTLFRAVLNAGLPVLSRYPHAYRVSYYEIESPLGFDASVYQPSLDFKFKNDTPAYILVQTRVEPENSKLVFELYGTPDGRKVEIESKEISNVIAPPQSAYQDDPSLPKGTVKQVDFAAWGSTAEFTRKVTRGGEIIIQDTYKSVYQPWRAVFLVGTKT